MAVYSGKLIVATALLASFAMGVAAQQPIANSSRKNRVTPDAMSAKIGSAVNWAADFPTAIAASKECGKPIFWYIPTIRGTFTDRKPEIDRYMLAGFFSWPAHIKLLNEHFVPIKAQPTPEQQKQFELSVYKFVEPGFIVLQSNNKLLLKVDRITTQHPLWFSHVLAGLVTDAEAKTGIARSARSFPVRSDSRFTMPTSETADSIAERTLIKGMNEFRSGQHELAQQTWKTLADAAPYHPLTWKAAAEAQGIGPFVRGFEVFDELPAACLDAGVKSIGTTAPANTFTDMQLWRRGVSFLLGMQHENGGFFDSDYDFGGADSLPNVHVAVTALVGMALIDAKRAIPDYRAAEIDRAIDRCFAFVTDPRRVNRVDRDEILWADAYRLSFISRFGRLNRALTVDQLQSATVALENIQSKRGTWYHEYENPFVTATALCALFEARQAGASVDNAKVERGLAALAADRSDNGAWTYSSRKNNDANTEQQHSIPASAGRMPVCELALHDWGQSDQQRLQSAIVNSFEFHRHLDIALKYDNHTSTFGYGGFFFWYDMHSRTEAIAMIANPTTRTKFMARQRALVLSLPEIDGCFIDSHELGRCYGTAMALMCLAGTQTSGNDQGD